MAKPNRINPIGISTHIEWQGHADVDKQLDLMKQAGVYWVRVEFAWDRIEQQQSVFNFSNMANFADYNYIVNAVNIRGMKVIALLPQYSAPVWRKNGTEWNSPARPLDYSIFAGITATIFKGKIPLYELGNEPDLDLFWEPAPDPAGYTALLKPAYTAIKKNDPAAKVISAGFSAADPLWFLTGMYNAGAKGYFDYLADHPYTWPVSPDNTTNYRTFGMLDKLQALMTTKGDLKPIMVTEIGWPSTTLSGGVTEAKQATYIGRVFDKVMKENYQYVPIVCVYDFKDDGSDKANPEHNYGIVREGYIKKPVFATMTNKRTYFNNTFTQVNP